MSTTKPKLRLFDVFYNWRSSGVRRTIRVEAFNEDDAIGISDEVFFKNAQNDTAEVRKPDAKRRRVHRHTPKMREAVRRRIAEGYKC